MFSRFRGAIFLVLFLALPARADDSGRFALAIGTTALSNGPSDVDTVGFHLGAGFAYHLGVVGPVLRLDLDRFATSDPSVPSTWFVGMAAGLRAFLSRPKLPVAGFLEVSGVVTGTSNPLGMQGDSFLGGSAMAGIEWPGAVSIALAGRYVWLADGPQLATLSLVFAVGAP